MRLTLKRWPLTLRVERQADVMDRVMQSLEVDAAHAARKDGGRALTKARDTCLHCRNCRACQDWLDAAGGLPLPTGFCPNEAFFRELMSSAGAARAFDKAQCQRQ